MRFLRAVIEGNYLALTDAARAKAVLARELKIKNPKIIDISYEDFRAQSPPDMDISMPGVENVLKLTRRVRQPQCRRLHRRQRAGRVAQDRFLRDAAEEVWEAVTS